MKYTDTFGYHLLNLRAKRGITEITLAAKVNDQIADTVSHTDIANWQNNQNLDMLVKNEVLLEALKFVLIEDNKEIKSANKARISEAFDQRLAETLAMLEATPASERDLLFDPPFGRTLRVLRDSIGPGMSEPDLAQRINERLGEAHGTSHRVTWEDIVALQSGRLPDDMMLARLTSAMELGKEEAAKLRGIRDTEIPLRAQMEKTEAMDALKQRVRDEVIDPLDRLFEAHRLTKPLHSIEMRATLLPQGGKLRSGVAAAEKLEGWFKEIRERMREGKIDAGQYEPLLERWKDLNTQYQAINITTRAR